GGAQGQRVAGGHAMNDPRRWLEQGGESLEVALLRSARADAPAPGAKDRGLAALGLATEQPQGARAPPVHGAGSAAAGADGGAPGGGRRGCVRRGPRGTEVRHVGERSRGRPKPCCSRTSSG